MLAESFASITNSTVVATNLENVVTNEPTLQNQQLVPCNHEEADTRLLLHVLSGPTCGYNKYIHIPNPLGYVVNPFLFQPPI